MRKLTRTVEAARRAMAVGSLDMDRERDIEDYRAMSRVFTIYLPILAIAPILAGLIVYANG